MGLHSALSFGKRALFPAISRSSGGLFLSRSAVRPLAYAEKREKAAESIAEIPEVKQLVLFGQQLDDAEFVNNLVTTQPQTQNLRDAGITRDMYMQQLKAGIMTFCSHVEARVASFIGEGFYTIGPCGEELMAAVGSVLQDQDFVCLHYRHLATQFARQLGQGRSLEDILLARARAHVISAEDEVTGGVHCALGGDRSDKHTFIATSTLASQCPPAVGRALGVSLANMLKLEDAPAKDSVSYVSLGDGSVNNAHFVSALNFSQYATYKGFRCPVVFGITDNNLAISLRGEDWLTSGFLKSVNVQRFYGDGRDLASTFSAAREAFAYSRKEHKPSLLVLTDVPRRFGHAATDRQSAYLNDAEIIAMQFANPLLGAVQAGIREDYVTSDDVSEMLEEVWEVTQQVFAEAAAEPKVGMENLMQRLHRVELPECAHPVEETSISAIKEKNKSKKLVMRRAMNRVLKETLTNNPDAVYVGEDVTHGGYYVVTENLLKEFGPTRIIDFPPEETLLVGSGLGFSQVGILPIVEIPYAKYLDCGYDMFLETIFMTWLSNAAPGKGVVYRLQGFGSGVFGGNHHTTNLLHLPPGLDVVCYSNGYDYARGWRFLVEQARRGRMVMSVDSTCLLNKYHCFDGDDLWRRSYPVGDDEMLHFHSVIKYKRDEDAAAGTTAATATAAAESAESAPQVLIVSYGNGVSESLQAAEALHRDHGVIATVVDTPLLSEVPHGLRTVLSEGSGMGRPWDAVVFADECKQGQNPYASMVCELQDDALLPATWRTVTAARTYNPLGHLQTFLSKDKILSATLAALDNTRAIEK